MGIKNIGKLINKYLIKIPIRQLSGKVIVVDSMAYFFRIIAVSNRKVNEVTALLRTEPDRRMIISNAKLLLKFFINNLRIYNIEPIFILEGERPVEKSETHMKRELVRKRVLEDISELLMNIPTTPLPPTPTPSIQYEYDDEDIVNEVKLKKLYNQNVYVTKDEVLIFRDELIKLGVKVIKAKGEGEQLCAMMVRDGLSYAAYSVDTDLLAYGCPLMINKIEEGYAYGYDLNNILKQLDLTYEQFVDMCILMGCDYNEKIKKIGPKRAYKLIKDNGRLENLNIDTSSLKYEKCRELFSYKPSKTLYDI
jgi:5'-3' exonuclease